MLTASQIAARDGRLTASRVGVLMSGDAEKVLNLWRELCGDPDYRPEDLSEIWPVRLGEATEALQLDWFEFKRGPVSRRGEVVVHPMNTWAAATLDGWSDQDVCCIECKHVGGREPLPTIISRYQPQVHWQMIVTGTRQCALSVIMGADAPIVEFIPFDAEYAAELMRRAENFMEHVRNLTPPVALPPVAPPVKAEVVYDMSASNAWAAHAATWVTTRKARKDNEAAEKEIKALVPADAARAHGHSIEVKRDRAGRLSLKECV